MIVEPQDTGMDLVHSTRRASEQAADLLVLTSTTFHRFPLAVTVPMPHSPAESAQIQFLSPKH